MAEDDGFNSKNWVWIPDDTFYSKGYVNDYLPDGKCRVTITEGIQETNKIVPQDKLENCNPAKFNKCNDMAELTHLNEPSVVYNLYLRYNADMIYTYSGLFLVAINPYKPLNIYDQETLKKFHSHEHEKPPPHIYAIAEGTYRNLLMNSKDQSILVTGESGAGKTENTKKIIQYLSSITSKSPDSDNFHDIDTKILQANPILESFGNSKTIKNNNSSRFGKFIKIYVSDKGVIFGANIEYYLLEKSRVVHQVPNERNYHVFYQFLKGAKNLLKEFDIDPNIKSHRYLKDSSPTIAGADDMKDFNSLKDSFAIMGFTNQEVHNIFMLLACILHLGNLDFNSWKSDQATFTSSSPIDTISKLLGVPKKDLETNLIKPKVKAGREFVQKSKNAAAVRYAIDAFSKYLYERIFQYIIQRINDNLEISTNDNNYRFIGVLDIAGFEIFESNSFEQLCINYTNEKLQQFFNHHSFILEQSEYLREDIQWEFIDFGQDLQPTIDLIEQKSPMGIFSLLDEECIMPKSSDKSFMESLSKNWGNGKSKKFQLNKFKSGFIVHHYAGQVEYNVENWLQKNTDPVTESLLVLISNSSNEFISELFSNDEHLQSTKGKKKLKTASQKHKEQLQRLMEELEKTEPHFVRCILPNLDKKPNKFDKQLVLTQLKCNGVLEGIRIARAGYPNKMTFEEFYQRYSILDIKEVFTKNMKTNSELIIKSIDLDVESYKIGITKIFFKNGILGKLEELRDLSLKSIFTEFQSIIRGKSTRSVIKNQIREIQAAQVLSRNIKAIEDGKKNNLWFDLFLNIKPLLEDSVKVLDTKKINESLKTLTTKLKDAEIDNETLEKENNKLQTKMNKLEDEILTTNTVVQEKDKVVEKLKDEEKKGKEKIEQLNEEINLINKKLKESQALQEKLSKEIDDHKKNLEEKNILYDELQKKYSITQKEIEELTKEKNAYILERKKHQEALDKLIQDHQVDTETLSKNLKSEIEDLKSSLELARNDHDDTKALLAKTKEEVHEWKTKHDKLVKEKMKTIEEKEKALKEKEDSLAKLKSLTGTNDEWTKKHNLLKNEKEQISSKYAQLQTKIESLTQKADDKDKIIKSLKKEVSQSLSQMSKIDKEKENLNSKYSSYINDVEALKKKNLINETKCKNLEMEVATLTNELKSIKQTESEIQEKYKESVDKLQELDATKAELSSTLDEKKNISESYTKLKIEYDATKKSAEEYSSQLLSLKSKIKELENNSVNIKNKENLPPDPAFVNEFANIKLKLNEQSASLRKEKFENQKLHEELKQLKNRLNESSDSLRRSTNRRSVAIGGEASAGINRLYDEIESLKFTLQQEVGNAQRAETYAIELQKKLNKLQSSRGNVGINDFEVKYKEAQVKIHEMENKIQTLLSNGDVSTSSLSKSESFGRSSSINATLNNANQDFVKIYQDITKTLKVTREELSSSKSEILRLKSLLRESEDELFNVKRQSFKTSVSDYETQLAQIRVRHESVKAQNKELTESLDTYKKRADEYYKKLELAESAIIISQRHEKAAKKELEETKTQMNLAREEARASQILITEVRRENHKLENAIGDKEFQIKQNKEQIKALEDKIDYFNKNYESIEAHDQMKEEIRLLSKDLNFKLETETTLIKENKKLQLDLEDITHLKNNLEKDCEEQLAKIEEFELQTADLNKRVRSLENDKVINERKINNYTKQVSSLKGLISDLTEQRDTLLDEKDKLEEDFLRLKHTQEETQAKLTQTENDMIVLREHLENQRRDADAIRSELNESKLNNSYDIKDYQKLKNEILVTKEENDSLVKVNQELGNKVNILEEKLYSNEQLKYWENKVDELTNKLDSSEAENHTANKKIKDLERETKKLEYQVQTESQLAKKYNDENFDYQNKVNHLKSTINILHEENSEKDLALKESERERIEMRENYLILEQEVLQLREKLGLN